MKLLADANVESAIVEWLRLGGYDVLWAAELAFPASDFDLLVTARAEKRVVLTHDLDFGEMVFRRGALCEGVILMRFGAPLQQERLAALKRHWNTFSAEAEGRFVLVSDTRVRIRPFPLPGERQERPPAPG